MRNVLARLNALAEVLVLAFLDSVDEVRLRVHVARHWARAQFAAFVARPGVRTAAFSAAVVSMLVSLAVMPVGETVYTITTGTTGTWNCQKAGPDSGSDLGDVLPGDIIKLDGGNRGQLRIINCYGLVNSPITIINDPADTAVVFTNFGQAAAFDIREFDHIVVDGSGGFSGMAAGAYCGAPAGTTGCGFQIVPDSNDSPVAYFRFHGASTTNVRVTGVKVDGTASFSDVTGGAGARYGFFLHDVETTRTDNPGVTRSGYDIDGNYVTGVRGTCFYVGPNWDDVGGDGLRLEDIELQNNLATSCGGNGLLLKSAIGGTNSIHDNVVDNTGLRLESGWAECLRIGDGYADIYRNKFGQCGERGIHVVASNADIGFSPFRMSIWSNVIYDTGNQFPDDGEGIRVSAAGSFKMEPQIFNNTVHETTDVGILASSANGNQNHNVKNNAVSTSVTAITSTGGTASNNTTNSSVSTFGFTNAAARDYSLTSSSVLIDAGTASGAPATDLVQVPRQLRNSPDVGAYEFTWNIWSGDTSAAWDCVSMGVQPGDAITLRARLSTDAATTVRPRTNRFWPQNCKGTEAKPIVLMNHPGDYGPVTFTQTANLGVPSIRYLSNDWVTLDGTGGWRGMEEGAFCGVDDNMQTDDDGCGIRIVASATHKPVMYISFGEFETNDALREDSLGCTPGAEPDDCYPGAIGLVMKGVLIDGAASLPGGTVNGAPYAGSETGRVGVYAHTASASSPGLDQYPDAWREQFKFGTGPGEGNVLRNLFGEALYIGNNTGLECANDNLCPRMRDIEVQYNWAQWTGRDGFNGKVWVEGDNSIHHNVMEDIGFRLEDWELPCIAMANSDVNIHSNLLVRCRGQAINENGKADAATASSDYDEFEPFEFNVWNNVIWDAGYADTIYEPCDGTNGCPDSSPQRIAPDSGYTPGPVEEAAIRALQNSDNAGRANIWMNTVVNTDGYCIAFDNVDTPVARNNLCTVDDGSPATGLLIDNVSANGTSYISDNLLTTTAEALLVNPTAGGLDFRLTASSPAKDAANSATITALDPDFTPIFATDFDGNDRPQNGLYDIGAFEFIPPEAPVITPLRRLRGIQQ
jgi:hypothetical protein